MAEGGVHPKTQGGLPSRLGFPVTPHLKGGMEELPDCLVSDRIAFSHDGGYIAHTDHRHPYALLLRRVDSGVQVARLAGHSGHVTAIAISSDGELMLTGATDCSARLWSLRTRESLRTHEHTRLDTITTVALSPNKRLALTAHPHGSSVHVWQTDTGEVVTQALSGRVPSLSSAAFSPDSKSILLSGMSEVSVWRIGTEEPLRRFNLAGSIWGSPAMRDVCREGLSFVAGDSQAFWTCHRGAIRRWDFQTGKLLEVTRRTGVVLEEDGYCSEWYTSLSGDGRCVIQRDNFSRTRIWRPWQLEQATFAVLRHDGWRRFLAQDGDQAIWSRVKSFFASSFSVRCN